MALASPRAAAARSSTDGGGHDAGRVHLWTVVVVAAVLAVVASSTTYVVSSLRSVPPHLPAAPPVIALPPSSPAPPAVAARAPSTGTTRSAVHAARSTTTSSAGTVGSGRVSVTTPVTPPTATVFAPTAAGATTASSGSGQASTPSPTTPTTLPVPVRNASDSHFVGPAVVAESVSAPVLILSPTPSVPLTTASAVAESQSGWPVPEPSVPAAAARSTPDLALPTVPPGPAGTGATPSVPRATVPAVEGSLSPAPAGGEDARSPAHHVPVARPAGAPAVVPPPAFGRAVVTSPTVPHVHRDRGPGADDHGRPHH